jgi:Bacteriophage T4-like portal protein (Gp20)
MKLFGFEITRKTQDKFENQEKTFATPENSDGAVVVSQQGYGNFLDLEGTVRTEAELVTRYREMALFPEVDAAIDEITNEAICVGEENDVVKIILDDVENLPAKMRTILEDEFKEVLKMLKFNKEGHNLFRKWYVDGRLYFHAAADKKKPEEGILELMYIDPRKIRKVREVTVKRLKNDEGQGLEASAVTRVVNEYYIYNEKGFNTAGVGAIGGLAATATSGIRIAADAIVHTVSGATDSAGSVVLSYLHKAIKPLNQLKTLEDATVIYRLVRAPERRVWKVHVGNLPQIKADQYVKNLMVQHRNRLVYDAATGIVRDDRKFITMLEDYWLPVRDDGKGTTVETLPSGELTGVLDDVLYFQKKLYNSLNVPTSRLNSEDIFSDGSGGATDISRAEVKFSRFIYKLRMRFCDLFLSIMEKQLILKNLITYDDWKLVVDQIKFDFVKDNFFSELKDLNITTDRTNLLTIIDPFVGKYYSAEWIRKNILMQTEDDIEDIDKEIKDESDNPQYAPAMLQPEIGIDGKPTTGPADEPMPKPPMPPLPAKKGASTSKSTAKKKAPPPKTK